MNATNRLATGARIGPFEIVRYLAQGGMGMVYLARQSSLGRDVALKVLYPHLAADAEFAARFRREAMAMARLEHPHIVAVHDAAEANGLLYIAMRYVPGGTLQQQITRLATAGDFMPVDQAIEIIRQTGNALNYAHQKNIIHRDIKPSNILCDEGGHFLLTDFGIALDNLASRITSVTAGSAGTAEYMSPEQARGGQVDNRSDIYSLGVMFYCMLANKPPFIDTNPLAVIYKHVHETPPTLTHVRTDLTPLARRVLDMTLAKHPAKRYQNMAELLSELSPQRVRAVAAPKKRKRLMPIAGGAAVVLAGGAFALSVWGNGGDSSPQDITAVPAATNLTAAPSMVTFAPALQPNTTQPAGLPPTIVTIAAPAPESATPNAVRDSLAGATPTLFIPLETPLPLPTNTRRPTSLLVRTRPPSTRTPAPPIVTRRPPTATPIPASTFTPAPLIVTRRPPTATPPRPTQRPQLPRASTVSNIRLCLGSEFRNKVCTVNRTTFSRPLRVYVSWVGVNIVGTTRIKREWYRMPRNTLEQRYENSDPFAEWTFWAPSNLPAGDYKLVMYVDEKIVKELLFTLVEP